LFTKKGNIMLESKLNYVGSVSGRLVATAENKGTIPRNSVPMQDNPEEEMTMENQRVATPEEVAGFKEALKAGKFVFAEGWNTARTSTGLVSK